MQHWPNLPQRLRSAQVLVRFGVRLLVLAAFAGFGSIGLNQSLLALFWMAAVLCAVIACIRRERLSRSRSQPLGRDRGLCRAMRAHPRASADHSSKNSSISYAIPMRSLASPARIHIHP